MSRNRSGEICAAEARRMDERLERIEVAIGLVKRKPTIKGAVGDLSTAIHNSGHEVEYITATQEGDIELTIRTPESSGDNYEASDRGVNSESVGLREPDRGRRRDDAPAELRKEVLERITELREKPDDTFAQSVNKRSAVLLHMIREIRAAGAFCDDTALQLTMYLLVILDNPGFDYDYYLDEEGPTCREVQRDINSLFSDLVYGMFQLRGRNLDVMPKGEEFLRHFPETIEQCEPSLGAAIGAAKSRPIHRLTHLATAMFLIRTGKGRGMSPPEAADHYLSLGWLSDRAAVEKAVDDAQEMLSKVTPARQGRHGAQPDLLPRAASG